MARRVLILAATLAATALPAAAEVALPACTGSGDKAQEFLTAFAASPFVDIVATQAGAVAACAFSEDDGILEATIIFANGTEAGATATPAIETERYEIRMAPGTAVGFQTGIDLIDAQSIWMQPPEGCGFAEAAKALSQTLPASIESGVGSCTCKADLDGSGAAVTTFGVGSAC